MLQHDALLHRPRNVMIEKLIFHKVVLERIMAFLQTSRSETQMYHREKVVGAHRQIVRIVGTSCPRIAVALSLNQAQFHATQSLQ